MADHLSPIALSAVTSWHDLAPFALQLEHEAGRRLPECTLPWPVEPDAIWRLANSLLTPLEIKSLVDSGVQLREIKIVAGFLASNLDLTSSAALRALSTLALSASSHSYPRVPIPPWRSSAGTHPVDRSCARPITRACGHEEQVSVHPGMNISGLETTFVCRLCELTDGKSRLAHFADAIVRDTGIPLSDALRRAVSVWSLLKFTPDGIEVPPELVPIVFALPTGGSSRG